MSKTVFCESILQNYLSFLDNTSDLDFATLTIHQLSPSLPQCTSAWKQHTPGTEGWKPHTLPLLLVCELMNGAHTSHIAHLSEWPSLPAQLKSGSLPHSHCQLKYPVRTQTGNKTKYHCMLMHFTGPTN